MHGLHVKAQRTAENEILNRLSRIEGQVREVHRMINDDKCSMDVVTQIQVVRATLLSVSNGNTWRKTWQFSKDCPIQNSQLSFHLLDPL